MTHDIQANYNSDGNYDTSSASTTQTVNPAPTVTRVTVSPSPSVYGQVVTIMAKIDPSPSVATPTGSVVFFIDGNTASGPIGVDGSGHASFSTSSLQPGSHTVTAQFTTNSPNFLSSTSGPYQQLVRKDYYATGTDVGSLAVVSIYDA